MRIAIVNDLQMARESLRRIVLSVPGHEIAWTADNGEDAVSKNTGDTPDLILMDLMMPVLNGVEATRRIMKTRPCPVLIVTATVGNHAGKVFEAMGHGALDAVNIPMMGQGAEAHRSRYILLRKIHVIGKLRGIAPEANSPVRPPDFEMMPPLIAIGASTGGPKALAGILSALPERPNATIVIVQHVDEKFSAGLADWLDNQTPMRVMLAHEGGRPKINTAYIAGTNDHLVLTSLLTFSYTPEPGNIAYRPSVDVFFKSVARHWPEKGVAVLLTGMGRDGAEGLAVLRQSGWHTIAQDEASSVVYGMPKAAKELGAVVETLPADRITVALLNRLEGLSGTSRVSGIF